MVILAIGMFMGMVFYGHELFGWSYYNSDVQIGLLLAFILGTSAGYKVRS